jgi:hypothetical protein
MIIEVDCSPEQLEVIGDHLLDGKELGMQPDERHWMVAQARKLHPTCKVLNADLNLTKGTWSLEIEIP